MPLPTVPIVACAKIAPPAPFQSLTAEKGITDENVIRLTGIYHNLIRQWAEMSPSLFLAILT